MRFPLSQMQIMVYEAAAEVVLDHGIGGLYPTEVAARSNLTLKQVLRVCGNQAQLATGLYRYGHGRITDLCEQYPHADVTGVIDAVSLVYGLVEQAAADPAARVVHYLEATDYADASGFPSIYLLWRQRFTEMSTVGDLPSPDIGDGVAQGSPVADLVDLLIGAVAGLTRAHSGVTDADARFDRLGLLVSALIPALSGNVETADEMAEPLSRIRRERVGHAAVM